MIEKVDKLRDKYVGNLQHYSQKVKRQHGYLSREELEAVSIHRDEAERGEKS